MYKIKRFVNIEYMRDFLNAIPGMYELVWAYKTESEIVALFKEVEL